MADRLSPNSPSILDTLGMVKLGQKDAKGALDAHDRAHALNPKDGEIAYHFVLALDANGKRDVAKRTLKSLLDSGIKFAELASAMQLQASWH
jgi:Flp pilus assembly protein TadD